MDTRKRLLKYVLMYKGRLVIAGVCGLLIAGCKILLAIIVGWFAAIPQGAHAVDKISIVQFGLEHGFIRPENTQSALLWIVAVSVVLVHIPIGLLTFFNSYIIASVTNRLGTRVRDDMYAHLQSLPLSYFHRSRIGHIMSRMSNDVSLIQNSSTVVMQAIDGPLMIIVGLAKMFSISWKLSVLALVFVPLMGVAIDRLAKKMRSLTTTVQVKLADVNACIEESVRGVRIVKSFGMEEQEIKRFAGVNNNSLTAALRAARRNALVFPFVEVMGAISSATILLLGGLLMVKGDIPFPDLTTFTFVAFIVAGSAKQFGRLNVLYQQTMAGAERIFELMDVKSDLIEDPSGVILRDVKGRVEFKDVYFEYKPGEMVLDNLSFCIEPGEVVAIVGSSGAGKSTVADLIPRFYDVTGGQILVENHDVRHINTVSLREHIAMVPQETILFSGTIADNISYGRPGASMEEIIEVARAANAHDFISSTPMGYQTKLGESGVGLSGGQRQRISIARALLKNPKILILDEATSSLDAASEGVVQEALDRLMQGRSTLVIAHRLSTVTNADRILVMDKGRVVESGAFSDLLNSGGIFAQLCKSQFRSEEAV